MLADVLRLLGELALPALEVELALPDLLQARRIGRLLGGRGVVKGVHVERVGGREGVFGVTWQVRNEPVLGRQT